MRTVMTTADQIEYDKKKDYVIANFKALGINQAEFARIVNRKGYKLNRADVSKLFTGSKKVTNRWKPILDIAVQMIKVEQEKLEKAKKMEI